MINLFLLKLKESCMIESRVIAGATPVATVRVAGVQQSNHDRCWSWDPCQNQAADSMQNCSKIETGARIAAGGSRIAAGAGQELLLEPGCRRMYSSAERCSIAAGATGALLERCWNRRNAPEHM